MTRLVHCVKLNKEAPGLAQPPFANDLGNRIYNEISAEAWSLWVEHQTMLINENRLSAIDPKSRAFLLSEMEKFFFGEGSAKPAGYVEAK